MDTIALAHRHSIAESIPGPATEFSLPEKQKCTNRSGPDNLLDPAICWQAIYSRDPRFDGRFFAAATTTGLYCRNVCPVPFARPKNILLFACAAAAESAGFRPCKRCQPQAAPGTPAWLGTSAVVSRAFRLILEGALNGRSVEELAERLGLGSRQLRRLFVQHLGASPLRIATTNRVHLARKLIDESKLPMTQIAFCSGFRSIREFNHAVRLSTGESPSRLRLAASASLPKSRPSGLELRLPYRTPFDWKNLIAFLKRNAIPGVEAVTDDDYKRTVQIAGKAGFLLVRPDTTGPRLVVTLEASSYEGLAQIVERVRRIFDLGADPIQIASHLAQDPVLHEPVRLRPGLRLPGVWDGFEAAAVTILGQRLTSHHSHKSVGRLVRAFGIPVESIYTGLNFLFPGPEILAVVDLTKAGIGDKTAMQLRSLAAAVTRGDLSFRTPRTLEQSIAQLRSACGVNESTAHAIAMRAFGEPDAFPASDRGLRHRMAGSTGSLSPRQALTIAERWRPWRAYAAMQIALGDSTILGDGENLRTEHD